MDSGARSQGRVEGDLSLAGSACICQFFTKIVMGCDILVLLKRRLEPLFVDHISPISISPSRRGSVFYWVGKERGCHRPASLCEGSGESEQVHLCLGVREMDMSEMIEEIQVHRFLWSNKKLYWVNTGTSHTSAENKKRFFKIYMFHRAFKKCFLRNFFVLIVNVNITTYYFHMIDHKWTIQNSANRQIPFVMTNFTCPMSPSFL